MMHDGHLFAVVCRHDPVVPVAQSPAFYSGVVQKDIPKVV